MGSLFRGVVETEIEEPFVADAPLVVAPFVVAPPSSPLAGTALEGVGVGGLDPE